MHPKVALFLTLACLPVVGCSPPRKVAVEERKTITQVQEVERLGGQHIRIVQPGDSLHGIAFANGIAAQRLAAWNGLASNAKLQVGQRLRLTQPPNFVAVKPSSKGRITQTRSAKPQTTGTSTAPNADAQSSAQSTVPGDVSWRWPTIGRLLVRFAPGRGQQGVDISGSRGQPVLAAQAGEVVYVGNGLKGYGNLVIVKHSDEFLSAYAHNLETFVVQGQALNAGQRLATVGEFKGRAALHFQIRRDGEPVDPLRYLPKK